ncbi:MAG: polyketide synthase, partial [Acidobacteria bacterium]|nr:polyketide synthase [Acidobacteriota bacterium]
MSSPNDIAIIGMACHFPGARNPSEYWRNLRDGIESVASLTDDELLAAGVDRDLLEDPDYVKAEAILADMDKFDADFFGLSPRDAAIMDPQHRHFFECSWEALENAGRMPETFDGAIGVYAGCGMGSYLMFNLLRNRKVLRDVGLFLLRHTGNDKDFLATRLSYELNLTGPSVSVQTACSTSLTAIHMACQSLLSGECDMALAGGVTIGIPHGRGYLYQEGEIMSKDGHCRPFDADSTGTIFGSGAGVVVLRRAADAIADGDNIRAIIRGSAINNDGSTKAGYLAPSVDGQAAAIAEAIQVADVAPESISFIETHGTGTAIGDVIEFQALSQAFEGVTRRQACALGSAKSNIGHLDTAA